MLRVLMLGLALGAQIGALWYILAPIGRLPRPAGPRRTRPESRPRMHHERREVKHT